MPKRKYNKEQAIEALKQTDGNVTRAAQILGVSRQTLSKYSEATPTVKAVKDQLKEARIDRAEGILDYCLMGKKVPPQVRLNAAIFLLTTQGRHRGYEKKPKTKETATVELTVDDLELLTDDELIAVREDRLTMKDAKIIAAARRTNRPDGHTT